MAAFEEIQSMEEETSPPYCKIILVLTKGNSYVIVKDWTYPFAPTTYYNRVGVLGVEEYVFSHDKGNRAYYTYVEPQK